MTHDELHTIDLVIIAGYLVALVFIGVYFMKKVKGVGDYYIAGRSFGPLVLWLRDFGSSLFPVWISLLSISSSVMITGGSITFVLI